MKKKLALFIFSIFATLFLIELTLQAAAGIYNYRLKNRNIITPTLDKNEIRILCEGDSTTAFGFNDSWPKKLEQLLSKEFPKKKIVVINGGVPASVVSETLRELPAKIEKYHPHFVITLLGVNEKFANLIDSEKAWPWIQKIRLIKFVRSFKSLVTDNSKNSFIPLLANDSLEEPYIGFKFPFSNPEKEKLFQQALTHLRNQRYLESSLILKDLQKKFQRGDTPYLYLYLGISSLRFNQIQEADKYFEHYLKIGGKNINMVLNELGVWAEFNAFKNMEIPFKYTAIALKQNENNLFALRKSIIFKSSTYDSQHLTSDKKNLHKLEEDVEKESKIYLAHGGTDRDPRLLFSYLLLRQKRFREVLPILEELIRRNPDILEAHQSLITAFFGLNHYEDAYKHLLKAKAQFPASDAWMQIYRDNCKKLSDNCNNQSYFVTGPQTSDEALPLLTQASSREDYRRIIFRIQNSGAIAIAMQYPRQPISFLQNFLGDLKPLFISNEEPFISYLKTHQYSDLFNDRPGGNFGHGTPLANQFIAKNAFHVIKNYLTQHGTPHDNKIP